ATPGVNAADDMAELKKRLSEKIKEARVITMPDKQRSGFVWWKVAAMIILVAGAGLLIYQFAFNKTSKEIAENKPSQQQETVATDSIRNIAIPKKEETFKTTENKINGKKESSGKVSVTNETAGSGMSKAKTDTVTIQSLNNKPVNILPSKDFVTKENPKNEESNNNAIAKSDIKIRTSDEQNKIDERSTVNALFEKDADGAKEQFDKTKSTDFNKPNSVLSYNNHHGLLHNNIFRGRVTDADNNPLPFANITNTQDSVGTYADANGYFNITSTDSVLNVRVQSLGFTNAVTELRHRNSNNQVVLKEDKSLDAIVLTNKKPNAGRLQRPNAKIEEPEPADGWEKYDLYLANNLKVPDIIRSKNSNGDVEVSFDVNNNGEPTNIKIEKSLCDACDKEAIRLIKQGPKWKHKMNKKRVSVRVSL
ncbi:MAG TPA: TonB family protein, partial [Chitinophagaceae bacterium]|nr:TonB family protein [Chitinophagaceae bacterium]